jgi:hypothetical protein
MQLTNPVIDVSARSGMQAAERATTQRVEASHHVAWSNAYSGIR